MFPRLKARLKDWAKVVKRDLRALYLAARDPRVPWYAKAAAACVAAYAFSPIDLIPDFVPVLGYLDDLIIVPLGIMLAVRLIPHQLMTEFRATAVLAEGRPASRAAAAAIVAIWVATILITGWFVWRHLQTDVPAGRTAP